MSALLEVQGLETAYGSSQVLFGIDLQIDSGQVATLLGRNGMGKTTTVRSMLGLTRSKGGTVRFRGERIDQLGADRIARMGLAVVPEGRQIFPNLSVEENLRAFAANRNATKEPWTLDRVYHLFPRLLERRANMGNQLSGGEQQMLALGRALMTNPHLVILDEATEGLAPLIAREIWRICSLIKDSGISSVIVDKNWKHVTQITDRNVILVKGQVVFDGSSDALHAQPLLLEQYLGV